MKRATAYLLAAASFGLVAGQAASEDATKAAHELHPDVKSQSIQQKHAGHVMLSPDELKWQDGPEGLPPGSQFTVLDGDPTRSGPFTMRGRLPAGYKVPPHTHPADEHVTVISGSLYMGLGSQFDESTARELKAGSFAVMYKGTQHFAFTREPTVIQLHGEGPWGINYVNPADDPRGQTPSAVK